MIRNIFILLIFYVGFASLSSAQTTSDSLALADHLIDQSKMQDALKLLEAVHSQVHCKNSGFSDEQRLEHLLNYIDCLKGSNVALSEVLLDQAEVLIEQSLDLSATRKAEFALVVARFSKYFLKNNDYVERFERLNKQLYHVQLDANVKVDILTFYGGLFMEAGGFSKHQVLDTLTKAGKWIHEFNVTNNNIVNTLFGNLAGVQAELGLNYAAKKSYQLALDAYPESMSNQEAFDAGLHAYMAADLAEEMYDLELAALILGKFEHRLANQLMPEEGMIRMLKSKHASILGKMRKYEAALPIISSITDKLQSDKLGHATLIHQQNHLDLLLQARLFTEAHTLAKETLQLFHHSISQNGLFAPDDHLISTECSLEKTLGITSFENQLYQSAFEHFDRALTLSSSYNLGERLELKLHLALTFAAIEKWDLVFERIDLIQDQLASYTEIGEQMFSCQRMFLDLLTTVYEYDDQEKYRNLIQEQLTSFDMQKISKIMMQAAYPSPEAVTGIMFYCEQLLDLHSTYGLLSDDQLYQTIENLRGLNLWSKNAENKYWQTHITDVNLLDQRQQLKTTIHKIASALHDHPMRHAYDSLQVEKDELQSQLNQIEQAHGNPSLLCSAISPNQYSLSRLQQELESNELFIEYFYGQERVYIMFVSSDNLRLSVADVPTVNRLLKNSLTSLSQGAEFDDIVRDSLSLLLLSDYPLLVDESTRIIIVPDGPLHHLPFESLSTPSGQYLVEHAQVSYHESGQFYQHQKRQRKSKKSSYDLYAFAPNYQSYPSINVSPVQRSTPVALGQNDLSLPGAAKEAREICELWGGHFEDRNDFSAAELFENFHASDVVHLGMHAEVDRDNYYDSYLLISADSAGRLDFGAISAQSFDTELVTLSACNTGVGTLRPGSGSNSLARGFLMTGINSVLMSLWQVPDETTAEIMVSFYSYLQAGLPKDQALQKSKIDYIQHAHDPSLKHPYFWSGFVLVGSTDALVSSSWPFSPILSAIFLFLALFVFLFYKSRAIFN